MKRGRLIVLLAAAAAVGLAETRRAVLVGIDTYSPEGTQPTSAEFYERSRALSGVWSRRVLADLRGAEADARALADLLEKRFAFEHGNVSLLLGRRASADAILASIREQLVERAAPGDVSLFYFAGHGSLIPNRKDPEGYDETLVAADAWRGAPDIRDKELARLFDVALRKSVRVTVIVDACHSASILRGWRRVRNVAEDGRWVADALDVEPPETRGALALSAAGKNQEAQEIDLPDGPHGAFSWALLEALRSAQTDASVAHVFGRARAMLRPVSQRQDPVLAGLDPESRTLLGEPARDVGRFTATVARVFQDEVELQAGFAAGLAPGCELTRDRSPGLILRVRSVSGPATARAAPAQGSLAGIRRGDELVVSRWTAAPAGALRVFAPPAGPSRAEIERAADVARSAVDAGAWVDDPAARRPDAAITWNGSAWQIESGARREVIGKRLTVDAVRRAGRLRAAGTLALLAPMDAESLNALRIAIGADLAVEWVADPGRATYLLAGRKTLAGLEYCWMAAQPGGVLPPRSRWTAPEHAGDELRDAVRQLATVYRWLTLESPPDTAEYPYRLELRTAAGSAAPEALAPGEYVPALRKVAPAVDVRPRWVYVLLIQPDGETRLLFPQATSGNEGNRVPEGSRPPVVALPATLTWKRESGPALLVLLTTENSLSPSTLESDGVLGFSTRRRGADPFVALPGAVPGSVQERGSRASWSIERRTLRSAGR